MPLVILSLWAQDESIANSVDYLAFSDAPEKLLGNVASILARERFTTKIE